MLPVLDRVFLSSGLILHLTGRMQVRKKSLLRRTVGPPGKWFLRRMRGLCQRTRDYWCPPEGEYSMMLRHAMNFVKGGKMEGDYLEFGVSVGVTMTAAFANAQRFGLDWMRFFAFDSFQGLPEISGIDAEGPCEYHEGQYACGLEQFKKNLARNGVDLRRLIPVPGWYDQSLNDDTKKKLGIQKAAVIWIDCDLYESTVPVLNFVTDYVQSGTIMCFDDFYCFRGDPNRGESRALKEWLAKNPSITAIEYRKFEAAGASFILNVRD
jgi:O-methyltransferase